MPKIIKVIKYGEVDVNITDVVLKDFTINKTEGKITVNLTYSLLEEHGLKYNEKKATIEDSEFTAGQKTYINNIIDVIETKLKAKEGI